VRTVYAFGSWARGAVDCADLDLVVHLECRWIGPVMRDGEPVEGQPKPPFCDLRKALIGAMRDVEVGDYDEVVSAAHFPENLQLSALVPIWRAPSYVASEMKWPGWRAALDGVTVDPTAGHAPHVADALPLKLMQTTMDRERGERAVRAMQAGLLSWEFRPHGDKHKEASEMNAAELRLAKSHDCRDEDLVHRALVATRDVRKRFGASKVLYWYGKCGIWAEMLAENDCKAVVITPKWTQRGPNGSAVITPGPNHTTAKLDEFERAERRRRRE